MSLKTDQSVFRQVRLSRRLSVDLTLTAAGFVHEWDLWPLPALTPNEIARYLHGRNRAAAAFAKLTGEKILMVDLTADLKGLTNWITIYPDGRIEPCDPPAVE